LLWLISRNLAKSLADIHSWRPPALAMAKKRTILERVLTGRQGLLAAGKFAAKS
jgi:hypothetical protein